MYPMERRTIKNLQKFANLQFLLLLYKYLWIFCQEFYRSHYWIFLVKSCYNLLKIQKQHKHNIKATIGRTHGNKYHIDITLEKEVTNN